ncbi:MAG: homocysteine biosynthesis protein [Proteobacteria bacterium]|nr:homocysteine biosynthesis protein [Pseudomonadota bacterium]MBU4295378.1 homocysteine biosynthesis protein [Pseudomonadota bacterium]MCG2749398.1 homocysteine biosynthesis protein [Desulfobulbaceae bacterium]
MSEWKVQKTYDEINARIKAGEAVVVTAEEMVGIVREHGAEEAARRVDVVTTGTFSPMCSSGAFINFGHSQPTIKASKVWLNDVPAYAGLAAVDVYIGAAELAEDDPLNKVFPGEFRYGGGHVLEDLVAGKKIHLKALAYGTDCYPNKGIEKDVTLQDLPYALLVNPRNCYQNYNCAVNLSNKTIYTYMGTLRPDGKNANYCSAGELSPLLNDPYYKTIGIGTRIFLGGGIGYVGWHGTQHNPGALRLENGTPSRPAGTLMVFGDMKQMSNRWLKGISMQGYGSTLAVGIGIPIPILNEDMARYTGVSDADLVTPVVDYSYDYSHGVKRNYGEVTYAQLKSGHIEVNGKDVPTAPLSSFVRAREIALILKGWIEKGDFLIEKPVQTLPDK